MSAERIAYLERAVANLHEILNASAVADDYPKRLAALHAIRDRNAASPPPSSAVPPLPTQYKP